MGYASAHNNKSTKRIHIEACCEYICKAIMVFWEKGKVWKKQLKQSK